MPAPVNKPMNRSKVQIGSKRLVTLDFLVWERIKLRRRHPKSARVVTITLYKRVFMAFKV